MLITRGHIAIGTYTASRTNGGSMPVKLSGATPTTVKSMPGDADLASEHGTIAAEFLLPQAVGQDRHGVAAHDPIFLGKKPAANLRLDAEHAEEIPAHDRRSLHLRRRPGMRAESRGRGT